MHVYTCHNQITLISLRVRTKDGFSYQTNFNQIDETLYLQTEKMLQTIIVKEALAITAQALLLPLRLVI